MFFVYMIVAPNTFSTYCVEGCQGIHIARNKAEFFGRPLRRNICLESNCGHLCFKQKAAGCLGSFVLG